MLATLIKVRRDRNPLPVDRLLERLQLVQWLRGELAAVETLLTDEYDRVRRAAAAVPGVAAPAPPPRRPLPAATPPSPVDGSKAPSPAVGTDAPVAG